MANLADLKRTPPTLQASVRISSERRHSAPPSRGANAPEFCIVRGLPKIGGRRECRMQAAPVSLACKESCTLRTQATTGQPNQPAFPARRFTAYTWSPRSAGLVSLRRLAKRLARLDPSIGGLGQHDFAVRLDRRSSCDAEASIASRTQHS